jgi:hypothetical protein
MSFKDYLSRYSEHEHSENEWGWFIDIENQELSETQQNSFSKHQKLNSELHTISKIHCIKYMKSYSNLCDSDKNPIENLNKSYSNLGWIIHATCLLSLVTCFVMIL